PDALKSNGIDGKLTLLDGGPCRPPALGTTLEAHERRDHSASERARNWLRFVGVQPQRDQRQQQTDADEYGVNSSAQTCRGCHGALNCSIRTSISPRRLESGRYPARRR